MGWAPSVALDKGLGPTIASFHESLAGATFNHVAVPGKMISIHGAESFTYWRESDGQFLGYLNAYPDQWTQGEDLEDLKVQLLDLYREFSKQDLPGIRKVGELVVA